MALRRMYLVPESYVQQLGSVEAPPTSATDATGFAYEIKGGILTKLREIEAEIQRLTTDSSIPDDQKVGLLANLQGKLQNFQTKFRSASATQATPVQAAPTSLAAGASTSNTSATPTTSLAAQATPSTSLAASSSQSPAPAISTPLSKKQKKKIRTKAAAAAARAAAAADEVTSTTPSSAKRKKDEFSPKYLRSVANQPSWVPWKET